MKMKKSNITKIAFAVAFVGAIGIAAFGATHSSGDDIAVSDLSNRMLVSKDKIAKDQLAKDQLAKDQLSKDQLEKDQLGVGRI
jgi:pentapeptide MXKDX repeat protein